jgi:hypothetical protein
VTLDERTRGVDACGQHATYVQSCERPLNSSEDRNCTWVMNDAVEPRRHHRRDDEDSEPSDDESKDRESSDDDSK